MRDDVRKMLIEKAKEEETVTYGELMDKFGIPRGHRKSELGIGGVVGEISNHEHNQGRPRLSAIVVRKNSQTKICSKGCTGGGFFGLDGLPRSLLRKSGFSKPLSVEEQEFLKKEQREVWQYWKTHNDSP